MLHWCHRCRCLHAPGAHVPEWVVMVPEWDLSRVVRAPDAEAAVIRFGDLLDAEDMGDAMRGLRVVVEDAEGLQVSYEMTGRMVMEWSARPL